MSCPSKHPVIVIVGPTASGKSDLAQAVALAVDGEIVSADSMEVYRGMDIGTAKPHVSARLVPHHGIDLVDPDETYSAALFQTFARAQFQAIHHRSHEAILAGGTGFYVRAALDDLEFAPGEQKDNPLRTSLQALAEAEGDQAVWEELHRIDPESAEVIHPHNVRRVIRAIEMHAHGESYAQRKLAFATRPAVIPSVRFGLEVTPEVLTGRIDQRVDRMMEAGLLDEVRSLVDQGFGDALTAKQAIGYKELIDAIEGTCTLDEAVAAIKTATRRLAKRQRSWFRRDPAIRWLDAEDGDIEAMSATILSVWTDELERRECQR